jgi:hypothetical protein
MWKHVKDENSDCHGHEMQWLTARLLLWLTGCTIGREPKMWVGWGGYYYAQHQDVLCMAPSTKSPPWLDHVEGSSWDWWQYTPLLWQWRGSSIWMECMEKLAAITLQLWTNPAESANVFVWGLSSQMLHQDGIQVGARVKIGSSPGLSYPSRNNLMWYAVAGKQRGCKVPVWWTKPSRPDQLLLLESAAIVLDSVKLTTDVGSEVQFWQGKDEAAQFYTSPTAVTNGRNTGGLSWSTSRFNQVAWSSLDSVLRTKPDLFQVWLPKQAIGISITWKNKSHIQDLLEDKCPNCLQPWETSQHLNRCPDQGRMLLSKDSISNLVTWMHDHNRTDPELAFWIKKYILFCGTRSFSSLVNEGRPATPLVSTVAASQDLIDWVEFLHRKVLVEFRTIQDIHCASSSCRMTGEDWMKAFVLHLIQISHLQWIFCNFTLHNLSQ